MQEYLDGATMKYHGRESLSEYFARVGIMRRKLPSSGVISVLAFNEKVLSVLKAPFPMAHAQVRKNEAEYRAQHGKERTLNLNELRSEMERYQKVNVPALVATASSASQGPATSSGPSSADIAELARFRANAQRQQANRNNGGGGGGGGKQQSSKKRVAAMAMKSDRPMYKYAPNFLAQLKMDGKCFNCGVKTQHLAWQCVEPLKDLALEAGHGPSQLMDSGSSSPRQPRPEESRKRGRVEVKAATVKSNAGRGRSRARESRRSSRSRSPSN